MFPPNDGRFPLLNRQFEGNSSRFPRKSKRNSAISKFLTLLWCRLSDGHLRNLAREADQCRRGHVVIVPRQRRVYTSIAFNRKFKWHSSFHRKVSKKDGNLQTHSSFPIPTGMTGKSLYHLWTPTHPGSSQPLFPPFVEEFSKWLPFQRGKQYWEAPPSS